MTISMTQKQEIIQNLLSLKTKSYMAEVKLLLKERPDEASHIKSHGKELSRKIDDLIIEAINDWITDADTIISDLKITNSRIQRILYDITRDSNIAENVVKLVGLIDDAVEIVNRIT